MDAVSKCKVLHSAVEMLQNKCPELEIKIASDFNARIGGTSIHEDVINYMWEIPLSNLM